MSVKVYRWKFDTWLRPALEFLNSLSKTRESSQNLSLRAFAPSCRNCFLNFMDYKMLISSFLSLFMPPLTHSHLIISSHIIFKRNSKQRVEVRLQDLEIRIGDMKTEAFFVLLNVLVEVYVEKLG